MNSFRCPCELLNATPPVSRDRRSDRGTAPSTFLFQFPLVKKRFRQPKAGIQQKHLSSDERRLRSHRSEEDGLPPARSAPSRLCAYRRREARLSTGIVKNFASPSQLSAAASAALAQTHEARPSHLFVRAPHFRQFQLIVCKGNHAPPDLPGGWTGVPWFPGSGEAKFELDERKAAQPPLPR